MSSSCVSHSPPYGSSGLNGRLSRQILVNDVLKVSVKTMYGKDLDLLDRKLSSMCISSNKSWHLVSPRMISDRLEKNEMSVREE